MQEENPETIKRLKRMIEDTKKRIQNERKETVFLANKIAEMTAERWVVIRSNRSKGEILGVSSVEDSRWNGYRFRLIDGEAYICIRYYETNQEVSVLLPVGGAVALRIRDIEPEIMAGSEEVIRIYAFDDRLIAESHQ